MSSSLMETPVLALAEATPWPPMLACWKCGGPGRRNLGVQGWCEQHLGEMFASFAPHIWMTDEQRLMQQIKTEHDYVLMQPNDELITTMDEWGAQLQTAIDDGFITRAEADSAWRRAARYVA